MSHDSGGGTSRDIRNGDLAYERGLAKRMGMP